MCVGMCVLMHVCVCVHVFMHVLNWQVHREARGQFWTSSSVTYL